MNILSLQVETLQGNATNGEAIIRLKAHASKRRKQRRFSYRKPESILRSIHRAEAICKRLAHAIEQDHPTAGQTSATLFSAAFATLKAGVKACHVIKVVTTADQGAHDVSET